MLIYSPETENKNEAIVNFNHCDVMTQIENKVLIFVAFNGRPVITMEYETKERAKQVFSDLMRAITDGKNLFEMPAE